MKLTKIFLFITLTIFSFGFFTDIANAGSGSGSVTVTIIQPTGTISSSNCSIPAGSGSCNSTVSWSVSNSAGATSVRQDGSEFASTTSSGGVSRSVAYGSSTFTLYNNGTLLNTSSATASCASGTTWTTVSGGTCQLPSGWITANNCTVAQGGTSCTTSVSWSISYPISPSIKQGTTQFSTASSSGGTNRTTSYNSPSTFYLYDNSNLLNSVTPTVSCITGTSWNGSTCAVTSYTVSASAGTGGTISPSSRTVTAGNTTTFTVTPNTGYSTNSVGGTCGGSLSGTTYTTNSITANCTVIASFTPIVYELYVNPYVGTGAGTINYNPTGTLDGTVCGTGCYNFYGYNYGTSVTLTATANTGNTFTGWSGEGCSGTGSCTVVMTANRNVTATFTVNSYTVSTSAGTGGSFSPTSRTVTYGNTTTFTITPNSGYYINSASGCSGSLSGTTYTTGSITANCTVSATFSLITVPTVTTTTPVTSIAQTTAVGGGTISSDGGGTVSVSGLVWSTSTNPTTALSTKTTDGWAIGGPWTSTMTGLTPNTTYYVRAYATNSAGTSYGSNVTFKTLSVPTVTSPTSSSVTSSTATLGANVTSLGNPASISARGICYGTSSSPTNCYVASGTTTGVYTLAVSSLTPGTLYYYRGYATNTTGTGYSADGTFTTLATPPTVTTTTPTSITQTTAVGGGNVTANGGGTVSVSGLVWSTSTNPTTALSTKTTNGWADPGDWTSTMTGLTPNTLYYVRAYATNSAGTSYGSNVTFTTLSIPVISSPTASNTTTTTATLSADITSLGNPATITQRGFCYGTSPSPTGNCTTETSTPPTGTMKVLVVGGGGGGGKGTTNTGYNGGAGGAGGVVYVPNYAVNAGQYSVTIGSGGAGATSTSAKGTSGGNSVFNNLTAKGGGGGGAGSSSSTYRPGASGGNGGGGGKYSTNYGTGGSSTQTASNGGYSGTGYGNSGAKPSSTISAGGGGGAGGAATSTAGGAGIPINGTTYAVGGTAHSATNGASNTGNGGGTAATNSANNGNAGGSGVVVVRYNTADFGNCTGGNTKTVIGSETVHTFTSGGQFTVNLLEAPVLGTGVFSHNITGLTPYTTYYYRAYAINSAGTGYSEDGTFYASSFTPPTVSTTTPVTDITNATAVGGGTIVSDGGTTVTTSGLVWSTSINPTIALSTKTTDGWASGGPWTSIMTGLTPNTSYHVRAYATNVAGTGYGSDVTFTSGLCPEGYSWNGSSCVLNNTAPNTPTITIGDPSFYKNVLQTFTVTGTDPDSDQIRYGVDWNNDSVADTWTNYVDSGTAMFPTHSWSSNGNYQVKALTQDLLGLNSAWSTLLSLVVTDPPVDAVITSFTSDKALNKIEFGSAVTLTWTSTGSTFCTMSSNPAPSVSIDSLGSNTMNNHISFKPVKTTVYTLFCDGPGGDDTQDLTITVGDIKPIFNEI